MDVLITLLTCLNTLEFSRFVVHLYLTGHPFGIGLKFVLEVLHSAKSSSRYLNAWLGVLFLPLAS